MTQRIGLAALAASALALASTSGAVAGDALAPYHWQSRVLLVLAADAKDPKLVRQRAVFAAMKSGAHERDLKLVEAIGTTPEAKALRTRFGIDDQGIHALLIGKDGGDKLSSEEPLGADNLFPLIDTMPMRQDEMRRGS